jgi:hypothetical protein
MDANRMTVGQRIARAVRGFERRRTRHGREWAAVFLNEETVTIALHGLLTDAERLRVGNPAGRDRFAADQLRLFAGTDPRLTIASVCGMSVRAPTVEIQPATGGLVLLFTTDTAGAEFPLAPGRAVGNRVPGRGPLLRRKGVTRRSAKTTGCVIRG